MGWSQNSLPWPEKHQREKGKTKTQAIDSAAVSGKAIRTLQQQILPQPSTQSPGASPPWRSEDKLSSMAFHCVTWRHRQWTCPCYITSVLKLKGLDLSALYSREVFLHAPDFRVWGGSKPTFISVCVVCADHWTCNRASEQRNAVMWGKKMKLIILGEKKNTFDFKLQALTTSTVVCGRTDQTTKKRL